MSELTELEEFTSQLLLGKKRLLQPGTYNRKLQKNASESYILNLSPERLNSFGLSVCPFATEGCKQACLNTTGLSRFKNVQKRRRLLSDLFFSARSFFLRKLQEELLGYQLKATKEKKIITIRLNGTSDQDFPAMIKKQTGIDVIRYDHLQFMDYTKSYKQWERYFHSPYHLTFSYSETNWEECKKVLEQKGNVAVVFHPYIPTTYKGYPVVTGDATDERFLDPEGVIVGLTYKKVPGVRLNNNDFIVKL